MYGSRGRRQDLGGPVVKFQVSSLPVLAGNWQNWHWQTAGMAWQNARQQRAAAAVEPSRPRLAPIAAGPHPATMGAAHDDRPHTAGQQGGGDELCRLRSVEFLENRLSPAERQQFSRDGYIVVPDALPAADFNLIDTALDGLYRSTTAGSAAESQGTLLAPVFTSVHTLSDEAAVVRMLTAPAPFAKAVDILGFNIALYHAHLAINPPAGETSESSNWGGRAFGYRESVSACHFRLWLCAY
jgi:hypothetical protein